MDGVRDLIKEWNSYAVLYPKIFPDISLYRSLRYEFSKCREINGKAAKCFLFLEPFIARQAKKNTIMETLHCCPNFQLVQQTYLTCNHLVTFVSSNHFSVTTIQTGHVTLQILLWGLNYDYSQWSEAQKHTCFIPTRGNSNHSNCLIKIRIPCLTLFLCLKKAHCYVWKTKVQYS